MAVRDVCREASEDIVGIVSEAEASRSCLKRVRFASNFCQFLFCHSVILKELLGVL